MTLTAGSRSARATAASTSSGIGGTIVFSSSGRFSVMVATGGAALYNSVSNWDMPAVSPSPGKRGHGFTDSGASRDEVEALPCGGGVVEHRNEHRRDVVTGDAPA